MNRAAQPRMAVITSNTLTGLGLRTILEKIIPFAEVCLFQSFDAFAASEPDGFVHYFIDSPTLVEHAPFFTERCHRTVVLTNTAQPQHTEMMSNICTSGSESEIVRDILRLHSRGHAHGHPSCEPAATAAATPLTAREGEVLAMIARGMLNKQIADRMGIALTTVISHRRNIVGKLGIRSVPALTIYAVTHGLVDAESI